MNCQQFTAFFRCVQDYTDGGELAGRDFLRAVKFALSPRGNGCKLARATALAVTAHLAAWLSAPLAANSKAGLDGTNRYANGARRYVLAASQRAAHEMGSAGELAHSLHSTAGSLFLLLSESISVSSTLGSQEFGAGGLIANESWPRVLAAATDDAHWGEIWIPALPLGHVFEDGLEFWTAEGVPSVRPSLPRQMVLKAPAPIFDHQEQFLRECFEEVTVVLQDLVVLNIISAFWPHGSTLLALVRWGRLYGVFPDGNHDCVDDDVDFAVSPAEGTHAWLRFAELAATHLQEAGFKCHFGGAVAEMALLGSGGDGYGRLLCSRAESGSGFQCPVSFIRQHAAVEMGRDCLAYGSSVPCPLDVTVMLGHYGGCPALPNISLSALSSGDACVGWMAAGLQSLHIRHLVQMAHELHNNGYTSMVPVLGEPGCNVVPMKAEGRLLHVGGKVGEALSNFYQWPVGRPRHPRRASCMHVVGDPERCKQRVALGRALARRLGPRAQGRVEVRVAVVDGSAACCPAGLSAEQDDADGTPIKTSCLGPDDPGDLDKFFFTAEYAESALLRLCKSDARPDILLVDPLPSDAGDGAAVAAGRLCMPTGFVAASRWDMNVRALFGEEAPHLLGLLGLADLVDLLPANLGHLINASSLMVDVGGPVDWSVWQVIPESKGRQQPSTGHTYSTKLAGKQVKSSSSACTGGADFKSAHARARTGARAHASQSRRKRTRDRWAAICEVADACWKTP